MSAKAIVSDPEIMGGEPCFAGTRIPVRAVKAFAVAGSTPAEIVEEYPDLTEEDVRAGRAYFATPTDPAASIIAAAEAWRAKKRPGDYSLLTAEGHLIEAIDAYRRQSRQPQGVKPSVSMVGCRFKFCDGDEICQLGWDYWGDRPMSIRLSDMAVSDIADGHR